MTIGSIANAIPGSSSGLVGLTVVGDLRVLVHLAADAMADEGADDREPLGADLALNRVRDVAEVVVGLDLLDCRVQRRLVVAISFSAIGETSPTGTVIAASA